MSIKKMLPMRAYMVRAKVFGYIVVFLAVFSLCYFLYNSLLA